MGLMKKAVRRATPRSVRKAKRVVRHPARTAVRAATPRPVRNAKRQVFNATHPLNTAENKLLNAAMPRKSRRRTTPTKSSSLSGSAWAAIITFSAVAIIGHGSKTAAIVGVILAAVVYIMGKLGGTTAAPQSAAVQAARQGVMTDIVLPKRITQSWIDREVPGMSEQALRAMIATLVSRGWGDEEIATRVLTRRA